ncbi:MAG: glucosaminidase domain-containing protein [Chitinophagia bacterium]
MKHTLLLFFIFCIAITHGWTQNNTTTIAYIEQFKAIAMKEMKRTGVPASITLAQAIVESNSGESNLAKKYNNHFGIKCKSDWTGAKAYQDDDSKQECFRAYEAAELSFKDHSNFLKNRPNYVDLFLLDPVDDTAWAYGLKKAGYATASDYPKKLLKIIDDYELAQYNFPELANEIEVEEAPINKTVSDTPVKKVLADTPVYKTMIDSPLNKVMIDSPVKSLNKPLGIAQMGSNEALAPLPSKSLPTKVLPAVQLDSIKKEVPTTVQTTQIAQVKIDTVIKQPKYNYPEGRFRINQVPVILGKENMSFLEIAFKYNVPLYKIFEYNEIDKSNLLEKDQLIFLAPKKKVGATSFHIVKYNTSLHEISQLEGVQLSALKMYNPQLTDPIKEGTQVLLFKQKDTSPMIKKDNSLLFIKRKK